MNWLYFAQSCFVVALGSALGYYSGFRAGALLGYDRSAKVMLEILEEKLRERKGGTPPRA